MARDPSYTPTRWNHPVVKVGENIEEPLITITAPPPLLISSLILFELALST